MNFNCLKFVVLRYGYDENLKLDTLYFSNEMDSIIDSLDEHRGLGIVMMADGEFDFHIKKEVIKIW